MKKQKDERMKERIKERIKGRMKEERKKEEKYLVEFKNCIEFKILTIANELRCG